MFLPKHVIAPCVVVSGPDHRSDQPKPTAKTCDRTGPCCGRGRADTPAQRVRFSRHGPFLCCRANHSVPSTPGPLPKPRRAATCGFFFLGPAPTAEQRLVLIFASAPRKRRRNVGVTNARRARQETGRRMPEYSKSWPRDPAGHTKCTHRSTRSPLWPARSQTTTPCVCRSHRSHAPLDP